MLDEKDLRAIAALLDSKMDEKIRESERRMMVMMESYFDPKFKALSEQINPVPREAIDIMEDRLDDVEKTVELHTRQIDELKKAQ